MENTIRFVFAPVGLFVVFALFSLGVILAILMLAIGVVGFVKVQLERKRLRFS